MLASPGSSAGAEVQGVSRVSEDGSHVYFVAKGRLTKGPREGTGGRCLAELSVGERAEETVAEENEAEEEAKEEPVTAGARCRPREGGDNLYVFQHDAAYPAGHVEFIATLAESDSDWTGGRSMHGGCR